MGSNGSLPVSPRPKSYPELPQKETERCIISLKYGKLCKGENTNNKLFFCDHKCTSVIVLTFLLNISNNKLHKTQNRLGWFTSTLKFRESGYS